jgi:hypothetical protein
MTTRTAPQTKTISPDEARNRAYKAAALVRTAIDAGLTLDEAHLLSQPGFRAMLLATTPRPANAKHEPRWTDANPQTWTEVTAIFCALQVAR